MADNLTRWLDVVDSTNSLMAHDKERLAEFSCYAAFSQTSGRGQMGNTWQSAPGENLTFSLLLRPVFIPVLQQFCVSQAIALGVTDYLASKGLDARIKWPNDIYVGERKICGILIENSIESGHLSTSIAGIGLNVNQMNFDSSIPNPTSIKIEKGEDFEIRMELPILIDFIKNVYCKLESPYTRNSVDARYLSNLYRRGTWCRFEEMPANDIPTEKRAGNSITGRILGIDPQARLLIELTDGTLRHYSFKEIKYVI